MDAVEFLELVTPSIGHLVIAEPIVLPGAKTNPMRHHVFSSTDDAVRKANDLCFEHANVFFALAGYREPRVWNPSAKNYKGGDGKWQTRTQANAGWLRALFLDLDVAVAPDPIQALKTYTSKQEALVDLKRVAKRIGLPPPMVIDSGGGIHVYWPFDRDLERSEWLPIAEKFKAICVQETLRIDPVVPADAARVLRLLGCPNFKQDLSRPVTLLHRGTGPFSVEYITGVFDTYEQQNGAAVLPKSSPAASARASSEYNNLTQPSEPVDFAAISFSCAAVGGQVACRGAGAREPLWFMSIGLAKMDAVAPMESMRAVSDGYLGYDEAAMVAKANAWNAGAPRCTRFELEDPTSCQSCPHYGKLTSPAQLGRAIYTAPSPSLELVDTDTGATAIMQLPDPPFPYLRDGAKIVRQTEDKDGNKKFIPVCPNDVYPLRILRHAANGEVSERTMWKFHLSRMRPVELEMPQSVLAEEKPLQKFLLNVGVYVTAAEVKETQLYMSAYLKKLSTMIDRERIYDRLGWQGEEHNAGFVVGERIFHMDGTSERCNLTQHVKNATKNHLGAKGTFEAWRDGMDWYLDDAYRGHRFFLYNALAAPIFHMTSHKGMMLNAVGPTGRGKTTCLDACGSIWGAPDALRINGNPQGSTNNAQFNLIGTYHSLPVLLDEITERDEEEMGRFALNISTGRGKERMKGSEHDGKPSTWETVVLTTANNDIISRIFTVRKDAQPHMMRVIGVDFYLPPTSSANAANKFIALLSENYGHAGPRFMQYVTAHYDEVKAAVEANMAAINTRMGDQGSERFWVASIAAAYTAGQIAEKLGLWRFPIQQDLEWMCEHVHGLRAVHADASITPLEAFSEFLESHIDSTLILSVKAASTLDNVVARPHKSLNIRHEIDRNLMFVSRKAVQEYFVETKQNFKEIESALEALGVILDRKRMKTMGADTPFAKAQIRCWMVSTATLGPVLTAITQTATMRQQSAVTAVT